MALGHELLRAEQEHAKASCRAQWKDLEACVLLPTYKRKSIKRENHLFNRGSRAMKHEILVGACHRGDGGGNDKKMAQMKNLN